MTLSRRIGKIIRYRSCVWSEVLDRVEKAAGNKNAGKIIGIIEYAVLLAFYVSATALTSLVARDPGTVTILGAEMRVSTFTGVLSSLGNISMIFLVVLFNKLGFITALVILLGQFPIITVTIIRSGNYGSVPGLFSNFFTIIAIIIIYSRNKSIEKYQQTEIEHIKEQQMLSQRLFEQTATALVNAVDAKDTYSHGHSLRVAEYSGKIARMMGKSEEEIEKIYYAALLHDVGKIGIDDQIINKKGRLTPEEYEVIKQHPAMGYQILSSISEYPYLSIGAHYHHERYDGKGYPDGLKGDDIPEIARIISVADSYDAMTSTRSYREALPQPLVREEIVKGAGSQFDPDIARVMQRMIDEDLEYRLRERKAVKEFAWRNGLECNEFKEAASGSGLLTPTRMRLHLKMTANSDKKPAGAVILFDASDGQVHTTESAIQEMSYFEYAVIWFDGRVENISAREIESHVSESRNAKLSEDGAYEVTGVKFKDHVMITIDDGKEYREVIIALLDSARFVYGSLSGEHCIISDTHMEREDKAIGADVIPRIAPEISYIDGPEGDIPNLQVNFYRTENTDGIEVKDGMKLSFHSMSLPTARLVWHCPYIILFSSADGKVNGKDYHEYAFIRLDGEFWDGADGAKNELVVKDDEFIGWNKWKEENKKGIDCVVEFECKADSIIVSSENLGLHIENTTVFSGGIGKIYAALTGDQCAITNIHVK